MFYIVRGSKQFGPFDPSQIADMVRTGKLLRQDAVLNADLPTPADGNSHLCVRDVLNQYHIPVTVEHDGNIIEQAKQIGHRIWFSSDIFRWDKIKEDKRLLMLGFIGLTPLLAMSFLPDIDIITFYAISLYFAAIWGVFYYYMFKTKQVNIKLTATLFFAVQILMFFIWGIGINKLNIFYLFLDRGNLITDSIGYILGVGITEEFVKAIPLFYIATRSKTPLIPQTMVFYGVMCGIAFGVYEGVEYQMSVNSELDYNSSFFANIARLTSLPFFHSMCSGLAGYFISFAVLKPRYRMYLYFLAIAMPAVIHGIYDTFAGSFITVSFFMGISVVLLLNYYLNNDKNVQSALNE